jgi:hypothetical protein
MYATSNHYTETVEGSEEGGIEEGEDDSGQENNTCINVKCDLKNRVDCIASIYICSSRYLSMT